MFTQKYPHSFLYSSLIKHTLVISCPFRNSNSCSTGLHKEELIFPTDLAFFPRRNYFRNRALNFFMKHLSGHFRSAEFAWHFAVAFQAQRASIHVISSRDTATIPDFDIRRAETRKRNEFVLGNTNRTLTPLDMQNGLQPSSVEIRG